MSDEAFARVKAEYEAAREEHATLSAGAAEPGSVTWEGITARYNRARDAYDFAVRERAQGQHRASPSGHLHKLLSYRAALEDQDTLVLEAMRANSSYEVPRAQVNTIGRIFDQMRIDYPSLVPEFEADGSPNAVRAQIRGLRSRLQAEIGSIQSNREESDSGSRLDSEGPKGSDRQMHTPSLSQSTRIVKTVFLSYRRTSVAWALAIFKDLTSDGYDVFFDFDGIASGDFERVILENIGARAHFLVLLTPSALERCGDPKDWLRREIETALDTQRNIVPIMLDGFEFGPNSQLAGKLAALQHYNGLPVPVGYFAEAMARLRQKYLNVPLAAVLHPASPAAQLAAEGQQAAARSAQPVTEEELRRAEQPRYLFTVKIRYQDEIERVEGTHAEEPHRTGLIIYDGASVVARYPDNVERWSRAQRQH